jgi:hypothetical protein
MARRYAVNNAPTLYFTGEEFFQRVRYGVRRPWPASASLALGKAPTTTRVTGDTSSTRLSATA